MGMVFVPVNNTALVGVAPADAGVASALINSTQQVGGSVGTALLNTIATTCHCQLPGRACHRRRGGRWGQRGHHDARPPCTASRWRSPSPAPSWAWPSSWWPPSSTPRPGWGAPSRLPAWPRTALRPSPRRSHEGAPGVEMKYRAVPPGGPVPHWRGARHSRSATRSSAAPTPPGRRSSWSASPTSSRTPRSGWTQSQPCGRPWSRWRRPARGWAGCASPTRPPSMFSPTSMNPLTRPPACQPAGGSPASELAAGSNAWNCCGSRPATSSASTPSRRSAPPAVGAGGPPPGVWPGRLPTGRGRAAGAWRSSAWASSAGGELNYSSDVDLLLVAAEADGRAILGLSWTWPRSAWRVDLDLRPEGPGRPAGPDARLLSGLLGPLGRDLGVPGPAQGPVGRRRRGARVGLRDTKRRPGSGAALRGRRTAPGPPAQGPGRAGRQPPGPGRPGAETGKGRHPRHRVRRPASAAGPRPRRSAAAVPVNPAGARGPGRRRLRQPRGCRRPGGRLPVPADGRAPPAAARGSAGPHPADPPAGQDPPGPGPRLPGSGLSHGPEPSSKRTSGVTRAGSAGSTSGCSSGLCWSPSPPAGGRPAAVAGSGRPSGCRRSASPTPTAPPRPSGS